MKCIIADAGPIIALCKVKQLNLLNSLFENCMITEEVYNEVIAGNDNSVSRIQSAVAKKQIIIHAPHKMMSELENILDPGESSSISLAIEQTGCALLIDEYKGRKIAKKLQLPVIGLAGVLILAKKKQLIDAVIPILLDVRQKGYWLSDNFLHEVAMISGEEGKT